jgi:flagellar hook-length control protein FliK
MTNLPITSNAPQTAAASKQAASTAETGDAQNTQPFGEVLARQIKEPNTKDVKVDNKLGIDALTQLGIDATVGKKDATDLPQTDVIPTDKTTTLPADMLAAMLPQVMNTAAQTTATPPDSKSDSSSIDPDAARTSLDKSGSVSLKANVTSSMLADVTPKAKVEASPGAQIKEQSFAAALSESASRTSTGLELNAAAREAISAASTAAATPQSNAAALASLQNTAAGTASPVMHPVQVTINAPVTQAKWADEFSQKITWLASSNKDQTAELHLNPPQLGPLDVVIKVSGDQATAMFTSPHAAVREAIEQAMPRLRDMLADNGIMLGNATVSDQAPRDPGQSNTQRSSAATGNDIRDTPAGSNTAPRTSPISRHNGIVDTFA